MGLTWQPWTSVSEGSSTPGAPIAAVPWGPDVALFIADPNGGIYAIRAVPGFGWVFLEAPFTTPGGHVTAVASSEPNRFTLFMADRTGEIWTASGTPYLPGAAGHFGWTRVAEGSTTPGGPIAAVPWGPDVALFIADPNGGIYAIKAVPGFGWEPVQLGRRTTPGGHVTAVSWTPPFGIYPSNEARFLLFMADVNGEIVTTSGVPYQGWDPWTSVAQGSTTPGAPVTPARRGGFPLFIADPGGGIRKTLPGDPPAAPTNLRATSVTTQTIVVAWGEANPASVELDGFDLTIRRQQDQIGLLTVRGPADRTASFTGLNSGVQYSISINAINANGYSPTSAIVVTTLSGVHGFSSVVVTNEDHNGDDLDLWAFDHHPPGSWQHVGPLPLHSSLTFTPMDQHVYLVRALDPAWCGGPPDPTNADCNRSEVDGIEGDPHGPVLPYPIS